MSNNDTYEMRKAVIIGETFTRLLNPLTNDIPELLIPVCGIPLIEYMIDSLFSSNIKEIIARGTKVIAITNDNREFSDYKVLIEDNILIPFITIIPMQLIAYEVAKIKKCDIDKPRNLAKSVTVE